MGLVADYEISLALPSAEISMAISCMKRLVKIGLKYPKELIGVHADMEPILAEIYPLSKTKNQQGSKGG